MLFTPPTKSCLRSGGRDDSRRSAVDRAGDRVALSVSHFLFSSSLAPSFILPSSAVPGGAMCANKSHSLARSLLRIHIYLQSYMFGLTRTLLR